MNNIKATIIADSVSATSGVRITTFELDYPRFVHSELMTHRVFSRNAASSRAIPIATMHKLIEDNPATPVHWGRNQAGMQANTELEGEELAEAKAIWAEACSSAIFFSQKLHAVNVHKQIANRVTETFQMMKTIVTATEYVNWYDLRNHGDAQPEIHELAAKMDEAIRDSTPNVLVPGEWHLPYVPLYRDISGVLFYMNTDGQSMLLEDAKKVSASCCAQVSYRRNDASPEKAAAIFDRLINSVPRHASPIEHQATPMGVWNPEEAIVHGATHIDKFGAVWSGNFKEWIQFRQTI